MKVFGRWLLFGLALFATTMPVYAEQPIERFGEFVSNPQRIQRVALIVDTFYVTDIAGGVHGIYREDAEGLTPLLSNLVKRRIENLGYEVPHSHANSGLFAEPGMELVYAKDQKSTGTAVNFPIYDADPPTWAGAESMRSLMDDVLAKTKAAGKEHGTVYVAVPESLGALSVDAVVVVSVISHNVGMDKTIGVALLTAGISAGISSGAFYSTYALRSGATVVVSVVDPKSGALLWHQSLSRPGRGYVGGTAQSFPVLRHMLGRIPNRAAKLSGAAAEVAFVEDTSEHADSHSRELEPGHALATDDVDGESEAYPHESPQAAAEQATIPPLPADPKDWDLRDAKRAYTQGVITAAEYKDFARQRKTKYKNDVNSLEADVKAKKIDRRTGDIEALKLRWIYSGL